MQQAPWAASESRVRHWFLDSIWVAPLLHTEKITNWESAFSMHGCDFTATHGVLSAIVSVCDWCHTLTARWDFLMQFTVLSAPLTSFNLQVVHILCSRGCLAASRIKEIGSSESVILYSAREISGARWEGRRMDEWWEYCSHSSPCSAGFVTSIS